MQTRISNEERSTHDFNVIHKHTSQLLTPQLDCTQFTLYHNRSGATCSTGFTFGGFSLEANRELTCCRRCKASPGFERSTMLCDDSNEFIISMYWVRRRMSIMSFGLTDAIFPLKSAIDSFIPNAIICCFREIPIPSKCKVSEAASASFIFVIFTFDQ